MFNNAQHLNKMRGFLNAHIKRAEDRRKRAIQVYRRALELDDPRLMRLAIKIAADYREDLRAIEKEKRYLAKG